MTTISELATKYEETLENTQKSILGIRNNITELEDDIYTIENVVMPQLESDMDDALASKALAFDSYYGTGHTVVTSGNYGITNLTEWAIVSGGAVKLNYYSSNVQPIHLEEFHTHEIPITLDYQTLIDEQQVLVYLDSSFNYNLLSMATSGDDIRFYTDNGIECEYWIEQWNMGGDSYIWVKIPKKDTDSFIMRFGNDTMTAGTSGNNTFDYFWDFTGGELPEGWEELDHANTEIVYDEDGATIYGGGFTYQLPDIEITEGYQVGSRVTHGVNTTGVPTYYPSCPYIGAKEQWENVNVYTACLWQARHRTIPARFYLYGARGDAASWNAYAGSYNNGMLDDTWYTTELGIDANGYGKSYWDHALRSVDPGTDTYYKPMNYITYGYYSGSPGTTQDVPDMTVKYAWVRKFVDYTQEPTSTLGTTVSGNSWITQHITMTHGDETTQVEVASGSPYHMKVVDFEGVDYTKVLMTSKMVSGSDDYLRMSYRTLDTTWYSAGNASQVTSGGYGEVEWDMSSDSNWTQNRIDRIRIEYDNFEIGDVIEFTEIKITDDLNENASFYADSFNAAYKHLTQPLGTNGTYGLKPLKTALTTGKRIQEANEVAISKALTGYQGLS